MVLKRRISAKTLESAGEVAIAIGTGIAVCIGVILFIVSFSEPAQQQWGYLETLVLLISVCSMGALIRLGVGLLEISRRRAVSEMMQSVSESAKNLCEQMENIHKRRN